MSISDVLKVFEYLSMGLESILPLDECDDVPLDECDDGTQSKVPDAANDAFPARAQLEQVVVAPPPSSAVLSPPLPGQTEDN
jgi:hypothetical protein